MKVLVIANNARSVACSAKKAGYGVYALDRFCDVDMQRCADRAVFLDKNAENKIYELTESYDADAVILGPGFENLKFKNVFNNPKRVIKEVSDKSKLPKKLKSLGIPHPETASIDKASDIGFPLMLKPKSGSGGMRNIVVRNEEELEHFKENNNANEFVAQEFVEGIPCSASLIGTGDKAVVLALNEQLIGIPWLTRLPFAYCGNITPFHTKFSDEMIRYATEIALEFKLVGSNGVDFILGEKGVYVIEVNPRFQGSMDTIELSTGMNVFDAHISSFSGGLPKVKKPSRFAAKAIVYADKKIVINKRISEFLLRCMDDGRAVDIPKSGAVIQPDEPVTTIIGVAKTRSEVLENVKKHACYIKDITEV